MAVIANVMDGNELIKASANAILKLLFCSLFFGRKQSCLDRKIE